MAVGRSTGPRRTKEARRASLRSCGPGASATDGSWRRSEADRQGRQSAERQARPVLGLLRHERELGESLDQCADRDLTFDPGERGAQTEVNAHAEGDVAIVGPRDVEAVGIAELR